MYTVATGNENAEADAGVGAVGQSRRSWKTWTTGAAVAKAVEDGWVAGVPGRAEEQTKIENDSSVAVVAAAAQTNPSEGKGPRMTRRKHLRR